MDLCLKEHAAHLDSTEVLPWMSKVNSSNGETLQGPLRDWSRTLWVMSFVSNEV